MRAVWEPMVTGIRTVVNDMIQTVKQTQGRPPDVSDEFFLQSCVVSRLKRCLENSLLRWHRLQLLLSGRMPGLQ